MGHMRKEVGFDILNFLEFMTHAVECLRKFGNDRRRFHIEVTTEVPVGDLNRFGPHDIKRFLDAPGDYKSKAQENLDVLENMR